MGASFSNRVGTGKFGRGMRIRGETHCFGQRQVQTRASTDVVVVKDTLCCTLYVSAFSTRTSNRNASTLSILACS